MLTLIVASDKNGVIGRDNKIPWRIRDDLVMLKQITQGHTVILGRKTYESMLWYYDRSGRPMPARTYIVITRNPDYHPGRDNARIAHSVDEAVVLANTLGDDQIYVIGGARVFAETLPRADRVRLTEIQAEVPGDAYFPALDSALWLETSRQHHQRDDRNEYDFDIVTYDRR